MPARIIKATFEDGQVVTRKTPRAYSHCWRARWTGLEGSHLAGKPQEETGFSFSEDNAYKRMRSWQSQLGATSDFSYSIAKVEQ